MEYYVYGYFNPLKEGNFQYENFCFKYKPFYIGLGKGNRRFFHLNEVLSESCDYLTGNKYKKNLIRKILKKEKSPIIKILFDNLSFNKACELEQYLIHIIGRNDMKKGPLTNLTNGGEGSYERICKEETKEKIKNSNKGKIAWNKGLTKEKDQRVAKYSGNNIWKLLSKESKEIHRKKRKEYCSTEEYKNEFDKRNPWKDKKIIEKMRLTRIKNKSNSMNKNGKWKNIDIEKIKLLYNAGKNSWEIADILDVSEKVILKRFTFLEIKYNRKEELEKLGRKRKPKRTICEA